MFLRGLILLMNEEFVDYILLLQKTEARVREQVEREENKETKIKPVKLSTPKLEIFDDFSNVKARACWIHGA